MKYCHNCGAPLVDDVRFCTACGSPLDPPETEPAMPESAVMPEMPEPAPEMPVIIEHRKSLDEYCAALSYVRERAAALGVPVL